MGRGAVEALERTDIASWRRALAGDAGRTTRIGQGLWRRQVARRARESPSTAHAHGCRTRRARTLVAAMALPMASAASSLPLHSPRTSHRRRRKRRRRAEGEERSWRRRSGAESSWHVGVESATPTGAAVKPDNALLANHLLTTPTTRMRRMAGIPTTPPSPTWLCIGEQLLSSASLLVC